MKKKVLLSVFLILLNSIHLFAQSPLNVYTRAFNGILLYQALGLADECLNVPVYLDSKTNSSYVYKWYEATESFGIRAKSKETPLITIECVYTNGKLTNLKQKSYTYTIEWDSDRIYKICEYDGFGRMVRVVSASKNIINYNPVSFDSKFSNYSIRRYYPTMQNCFFEEINYGTYGHLASGYFYDVSTCSPNQVVFEVYGFEINKRKGHNECTLERGIGSYRGYPLYYIQLDGKIYCSSARKNEWFESSDYIKEVERIY